MPTYVYQCSSCHAKHEIIQKITEDPIKLCPSCQKETLVRIIPDSIAIQFKGSGFYINDYAKPAPEDKKPTGGCKTDCGCKE